jgi:hypothetical protein
MVKIFVNRTEFFVDRTIGEMVCVKCLLNDTKNECDFSGEMRQEDCLYSAPGEGVCPYLQTLRLFTLEDKVRGNGDPKTVAKWKVKNNSAIPYGTYETVVDHSPKFKDDLLRLLLVPGFEGIRIHAGNSPKDTAGCILVGLEKTIATYGGPIILTQSRAALKMLMDFVKDEKEIVVVIGKEEA